MHTSPPLFLPERCLFLSARCVKKPVGCTAPDRVSPVSHVSVKQRMLQSLMSLWNATLARISSTLLSRDWTLARRMLGSGARCARVRSLTRRPLRFPLLRSRFLGSLHGINSVDLFVRQNTGSASRKTYYWSY
uniref:SJCHGC03850 protein n=1 Tax=Schistosoma japonicum TaxID=6182 RepID=Q5DE30_SCHJA|nr:SJCHGC03850 protein [Schistosoma japonicum]